MDKDLFTPETDPMKANFAYRQGFVSLAPAELVRVFGHPHHSDECKTSGEYIFSHKDGDVFTLYDYCVTTLYTSSGWRPDEFWASEEAYDFHIGGQDAAYLDEFRDWLEWMMEDR